MNTDEIREKLAEKSKEEIIEKMVQMANDNYLFDQVHKQNKFNWATLPFIPEDLGFEEIETKHPKEGYPMRVYHRDGIACTRTNDGWRISAKQGEEAITIKIKNKFLAYQIFTALGLELESGDSTVPDIVNKDPLKAVEELMESGKINDLPDEDMSQVFKPRSKEEEE